MPTKSRNRRSPKRLARRMKPTRHLSRRKGSGKKGEGCAEGEKTAGLKTKGVAVSYTHLTLPTILLV